MFTLSFGIPITISPFFFVVAFLLGFLISGNSLIGGLIGACVILVSILVHEFGHALTGIFFKQKVKISLHPFGGLTERQGPHLKKWQEFLIILNGPVAGFLLYLFSVWLAAKLPPNAVLLQFILLFSAEINFYWTLLNLIPVLPLDGGQLVRVVLQGIFGVKGLRFTALLSLILAALAAIYFIYMQNFFAGSIFAIFAMEAWRTYKSVHNMSEKDEDKTLQNQLKNADRLLKKGEINEAYNIYSHIRDESSAGMLNLAATSRMAEIEASRGHFQEGYELLKPLKSKLEWDMLPLYQNLAFQLEYWAEALEIGTIIGRENQNLENAIMNAMSAAQLNQPDKAIGWLKSYFRLGGDKSVLKDHRFDPIKPRLNEIDGFLTG